MDNIEVKVKRTVLDTNPNFIRADITWLDQALVIHYRSPSPLETLVALAEGTKLRKEEPDVGNTTEPTA